MALFQKRETVFCRRDKAGWKAARQALKEAGIQGVRCGQYDVEKPVCGCGAKLDPRDFCGMGVERSMYTIKVPPEEAQRARQIVEERLGPEEAPAQAEKA